MPVLTAQNLLLCWVIKTTIAQDDKTGGLNSGQRLRRRSRLQGRLSHGSLHEVLGVHITLCDVMSDDAGPREGQQDSTSPRAHEEGGKGGRVCRGVDPDDKGVDKGVRDRACGREPRGMGGGGPACVKSANLTVLKFSGRGAKATNRLPGRSTAPAVSMKHGITCFEGLILAVKGGPWL